MSQDQKLASKRTVWAVFGLLLIPVLCCTAPLLIGAGAVGALGFIGAAANNVWVSVVSALIAVGVVGGLLYRWWGRKKKPSGANDCCQPSSSVSPEGQSRETQLPDSRRVNDRESQRCSGEDAARRR